MGLMADIPNDRVLRRFEHAVKRQRQLNGAQRRAQVAAVLGDDFENISPQFFGKNRQVFFGQRPDVGGAFDAF